MKKPKTMKGRKNIMTLLDILFSEIVRKRDINETCITCGLEFKGRRELVTCGHFRKRRHLATRWNLKNAYGQCMECNSRDDENLFAECLANKIGQDRVDEIVAFSRIDMHYTISDLQHIYDELNKYYKQL